MRRKGFTFLELLIALSIFAVGMVSALNVFPLNRRYLLQSQYTSQAGFLAQEEVEYIRTLDYANVTTGTFEASHAMGTSTDPLSFFSRQTVVGLIDTNRNATVTDVGLKQITVTVSWSERGISRQYVISSYVYNQ